MRPLKIIGVTILFLSLASLGSTEDFSLQYFLAKASSKGNEVSKKEKTELLNRIEEVIGQAQRINGNLLQMVQSGEVKVGYQEGTFWMSRFEGDRGSIETGIQQLRLMKEKTTHLTAAVKLYKCLRDISSNFNAYNDTPLFSAFVGDIAPEIELWADPVFYKLYLLPLAYLKDGEEKIPPTKDKIPVPKDKKP